jgi:ammonia channel protein AmtB
MMILLGFAAACTAGILLPLNWTIGIRLAREDEIEGLDAAGILLYCIEERINKIINYCSSW